MNKQTMVVEAKVRLVLATETGVDPDAVAAIFQSTIENELANGSLSIWNHPEEFGVEDAELRGSEVTATASGWSPRAAESAEEATPHG